MSKLVIELTDRCNLRCQHCPSGRHGGRGELDLSLLDRVLDQASAQGIDYLAFTGGEPTLHSRFPEILRRTATAGYHFSLVSNGWVVAQRLEQLLPYRDQLFFISFSLDGAREVTHDAQRGAGSFRRLMQAASACMRRDIPFAFNMSLTRRNWCEAGEVVELASRLGSRRIKFIHLMNTPLVAAADLVLSPAELKEVDRWLRELQATYDFPVVLAAGGHALDLSPCTPLRSKSFNLDWQGNVGLCCNLSGLDGTGGAEETVGNLWTFTLGEAMERLQLIRQQLHSHKLHRQAEGRWRDSDYFPCWYCSNYFHKVNWLRRQPDHPWHAALHEELHHDVDPGQPTTGSPRRDHYRIAGDAG
ncbi:MAG: radical SAM protein [Candidatus Competibacteraceae bacterium]